MRFQILILCVLIFITLSCAGGHDPLAPSPAPLQSQVISEVQTTNRTLFGLWIVDISEDHNSIGIIPVRTGTGHFNIRTFLEDGPCTNCLSVTNFTNSGNGFIDVDVQISHPFVGVDTFTGFDVRGTVIFPTSSIWTASGLTWSQYADGGAELLNPDGWTSIFNPIEYPKDPGDPNIFTYQQGSMATVLEDASTLNPYRTFFKQPNRRPFFTSDVITSTYELRIIPGAFKFGYAVDASWEMPYPSPPENIPDDFPISANSIEPYRISAHVGEGLAMNGGSAECEIDIYDWQGTSTVSGVMVESPWLFDGFAVAELETDFGTISRWSVKVINDKNLEMGDYPLLVITDSIDTDPFLGAVTAYQIIYASVGEPTQYPEGIYVDRDYPGNAGGYPELGTPEAPFTTINKGVIVAEYGATIYIDPSPDPYNEQVFVKSGCYLLGDNWRPDGDSGQPVVEAMEYAASMYATGVDDVTIDNLEVRPGGDLEEPYLWGIQLSYTDPYEHHQNVTVKNCTFTGDRVHAQGEYGDEVICCEAVLTDNFIFEDNVITEVHVGSIQGGYLGGLHVDVCDGVIVRRNKMYNCTTKNSFLGMHVWYSDEPVLVEYNEFGPLTNSDTPTGFTIGWAINVISYSDVTVRHNIVHDLGEPGHRIETVGLFFRAVGEGQFYNWTIENNLIYNLHSQDAENTYNSADCRGIMFRSNSSNDLDGLVIANNTIVNLESGEYVRGLSFDIGPSNHITNYRIENNIFSGLKGPASPDAYYSSGAVYCYWPMDDLEIKYSLFHDVDLPDPMFYGIVEGEGIIIGEDPMLLPDWHLPIDSPAQLGDPDFLDWNDTGSASGDPDNPDPETRSRMGAYGGPEGNW